MTCPKCHHHFNGAPFDSCPSCGYGDQEEPVSGECFDCTKDTFRTCPDCGKPLCVKCRRASDFLACKECTAKGEAQEAVRLAAETKAFADSVFRGHAVVMIEQARRAI